MAPVDVAIVRRAPPVAEPPAAGAFAALAGAACTAGASLGVPPPFTAWSAAPAPRPAIATAVTTAVAFIHPAIDGSPYCAAAIDICASAGP